MSVFPPVVHGVLREHYLLFGATGAVAMVVGSLSAWLGAQFGARRVLREMREAQLATGDEIAGRFRELGQSLEDVALEVERLAEGQRFTARVLTERSAISPLPPAPTKPPGETTPH